MTKDEALKLALEALESYKNFIDDAHIIEGQWHWIDGADAAITAIKEARSAPVQEPMALEEYDAGLLNDYGGGNVEWWQDYIRAELGRAYEHYQSQMATPPAAQPAQEAWREFASDYERGVIDGRQMQAQSSVDKAVNAMAQRPWVGLTDEEIDAAWRSVDYTQEYGLFRIAVARAIEAKLKEKNT